MPANFFEKARNIWADQSLYKQMTTSGSLVQLLKKKVSSLFDAKNE